MPSLVLRYERDEISRVFQYGCVVETWDNVVGRGASSSKRRRYKKAFTGIERAFVSKWHTRFAKWSLVTGSPGHIYFRNFGDVALLLRAIHFFATE